MSTAYHPQSDGQTEVTNRGLETYLRCYTSDKPKAWSRYLPWAELCYNSSFHSAIKMTPFKAVYGRDPPFILKYEQGSTSNADLESKLIERDNMLSLIREHISHAQQVMKKQVDGHRREVEFELGDMVYLKLRPYRQQSLARRANEKLSARFYGPYEVIARVGKVAYRLKLPEDAKIHPTFHVSQLKKAIGDDNTISPLPPLLTAEGVLVAQPEKVLGSRVSPVSGQDELLIQWKGLPDYESSWEWKKVIQGQFPEFDLEDKVNFAEGGNVRYEALRPPLLYEYTRRKKGSQQKTTTESCDVAQRTT